LAFWVCEGVFDEVGFYDRTSLRMKAIWMAFVVQTIIFCCCAPAVREVRGREVFFFWGDVRMILINGGGKIGVLEYQSVLELVITAVSV